MNFNISYYTHVSAVALAFEAQMVDTVPTAAHDIDVDILITASNVFEWPSQLNMNACLSRVGQQQATDLI